MFGQGKVAFANFSIATDKLQFVPLEKKDDMPTKILEYSSGKYENIPFSYPSSLSEEQIELLIEKLQVHSQYEILSVAPSIAGFSKYEIMTCSAGARVRYFYNAGESFQFDFDTYKIKEFGNWIQ